MGEVELKCRIDEAFCVSRDEGKLWMDSARSGDLRTMSSMLNARAESDERKWKLLHYNGQGTSYGFVGSVALHWAAARGDELMLKKLLQWGSSVNVQNHGGSSPLHSAVANMQLGAAVLLIRSAANPFIQDCCGDTALDIAKQRNFPVDTIRLMEGYDVAQRLLLDEPPTWKVADMRLLVSLVERSTAKHMVVLERAELVEHCAAHLNTLKVELQRVATVDERARDFLSEIRQREIQRQVAAARADNPSEGFDDDSDDVAFRRAKALELKERGNEHFREGNHKDAIRMYTAAIAVDPTEFALYSNRAASYLQCNLPIQAVQDARVCVQLRPEWSKGHYRLGCGLQRLGRYQDAIRAFETAVGVESDPKLVAEMRSAVACCCKELDNESRNESSPCVKGKRPWFDCPLCENKTRDEQVTPCCQQKLCGTCWKRRRGDQSCPFSCH